MNRASDDQSSLHGHVYDQLCNPFMKERKFIKATIPDKPGDWMDCRGQTIHKKDRPQLFAGFDDRTFRLTPQLVDLAKCLARLKT